MRHYVAGRLLSMIPVVFGVSIVVFLVLHLAPGDPVQVMLGPQANANDVQQLREQLGLDKPLYVQYGSWVIGVLKGDLGYSLLMNEPVAQEIGRRFGATAILAGASLLISTVVGIAFGAISAIRHYSWTDKIVTLSSLIGVSMPEFWLGLVLLIVFALKIRVFPPSGMFSPTGADSVIDLLHHLVLPALTLAAPAIAFVARMTRSAMLDVLRQEYVQTARAKGVAGRNVILRHALRNAMIAVVTVIGVQVGYLLGGTVIIETVFGWPGLGSLLVQGVGNRDFPVVQGTTLVIAMTFVLVNLAVDFCYGYFDPRIRYA